MERQKLSKNVLAQPFLKWAGGKRQLLPEIRKYIPAKYGTYFEPFVGAGAVLFDLQPKKAIFNDINSELINTYGIIRDNLEELLEDLKKHKNESEYFYSMRELDRDKERYNELSDVQRASRIIYLNKTCFNGLFRVNSSGQFNVPFGKYKNPKIVDEIVLRAVNHYLSKNNVTMLNGDFKEAVKSAKKGDFVYFDPPYDPVSDTASFTGYALGGFGKKEQEELKLTVDKLTKKGCKVLLSNSATDYIKELYKDYHIEIIPAKRAINSVASKRGEIDEVLVMNYEFNQ